MVARLLQLRGMHTPEQVDRFLRPRLEDLLDPWLMKDMDLAVERIQEADQNGERIVVYGDYDVDGATSVSLMSEFLRNNGFHVEPYIPDRYKEGYGLSRKGIDHAEKTGCTLIIMLDCGIRACELIGEARSRGIDTIVCDHHLPGPELPPAYAILNPKQEDCPYPFKHLSGCGVGFKLTQALVEQRGLPDVSAYDGLDLVALSIAADLVEVTGENRVMLYHGMERIKEKVRPGISALIRTAHCSPDLITARDILFRISPRINAAGRIGHAMEAVDLLISHDNSSCNKMAADLDRRNDLRRQFDAEVTESALRQLESHDKYPHLNIVWGKGWHRGVIGIVASRLIEHRHRPSVVISDDKDLDVSDDQRVLVGSARSVLGVDIHEALRTCSEHLDQFGGHSMAAGLTIKPGREVVFAEALDRAVADQLEEGPLLEPKFYDMEVDLADLKPSVLQDLRQFEPYGPGAKAPVFLARNLRHAFKLRLVGKDERHLRVGLGSDTTPYPVEAIAFNFGEDFQRWNNCERFTAVFNVQSETYRGEIKPRVAIEAWWPEGEE